MLHTIGDRALPGGAFQHEGMHCSCIKLVLRVRQCSGVALLKCLPEAILSLLDQLLIRGWDI